MTIDIGEARPLYQSDRRGKTEDTKKIQPKTMYKHDLHRQVSQMPRKIGIMQWIPWIQEQAKSKSKRRLPTDTSQPPANIRCAHYLADNVVFHAAMSLLLMETLSL
jgi:hypothetical protein